MPRILITHNRELLTNFFSERAVVELRKLGDVILNESDDPLSGDRLIAAAKDCDIVISDRLAPGHATVFDQLPNLSAFLRCAVDARNVDVEAASRNGVLTVRCSAGYAEACGELAIGLMIDLARQVSTASAAYHSGVIDHPMVFGRQLFGSDIGIVGYGAIGRYLAGLALAFGMRVRVYDPYVDIHHGSIDQVSFEELLGASHFVVCAAYATPETEKMMNKRAFSLMRSDAYFINISRGILVDEEALLEALITRVIAGAGLDVGLGKDQQPHARLACLPNVVATPHVAGLTPEASDYQAMECVRQVQSILAGKAPALSMNAQSATRFLKLKEGQA